MGFFTVFLQCFPRTGGDVPTTFSNFVYFWAFSPYRRGCSMIYITTKTMTTDRPFTLENNFTCINKDIILAKGLEIYPLAKISNLL